MKCVLCTFLCLFALPTLSRAETAEETIGASGVQGGLVAHIHCKGVALTASYGMAAAGQRLYQYSRPCSEMDSPYSQQSERATNVAMKANEELTSILAGRDNSNPGNRPRGRNGWRPEYQPPGKEHSDV